MRILLILLLSAPLVLCGHLPKKYLLDSYLDNPVVKNFMEYVRIDTSKEENLELAVDFWQRKAQELELDFNVYYPGGLPICVLSWYGTDPSLPSIMLNSHMDVVLVEEEDWTYPPFSAYMDENGDIFGRGTQDDKDVGIMYLEAIREMIKNGIKLKRTLHITLMPDEETGGARGMVKFIETKEFKDMNIGFALDEGLVSADDRLQVSYQDKRPWQMKFTTRGPSGHGSSVLDSSAMEKFMKLIDVIGKHRDEQTAIMKVSDPLDFGAYDSVNINIVKGGVKPNVIPGRVELVVDTRLAVSTDVTEMSNRVSSWIQEAGNDTSIEFIRQILVSKATKVDDSNPYWVTMRNAVQELGIEIDPVICPATSDMVNIRKLGIPALGFAFKTRTKNRYHAADEYLNVDNLLHGVTVYIKILSRLGKMGDVVYVQ